MAQRVRLKRLKVDFPERDSRRYQMSYNKDTKPIGKKITIPFLELVTGHKFKVIDVVTLPKENHSWCAFCKGRLYTYIEIEREDKKKFWVGKRCLGKVGLTMNDMPEKFPHLRLDYLDDEALKGLSEL
jgi:ribosomal protein L44E